MTVFIATVIIFVHFIKTAALITGQREYIACYKQQGNLSAHALGRTRGSPLQDKQRWREIF